MNNMANSEDDLPSAPENNRESANEIEDEPSLTQLMLHNLECSVCKEVMVPPRHGFLFVNGHATCDSCLGRLNAANRLNCPVCRDGAGFSRCLFLDIVGAWILDNGLAEAQEPSNYLYVPQPRPIQNTFGTNNPQIWPWFELDILFPPNQDMDLGCLTFTMIQRTSNLNRSLTKT